MALNDKNIIPEQVTDVVELPNGVHETRHQPATLVKYASGKHQFLNTDEYQKQKHHIEWYRREESIDGN